MTQEIVFRHQTRGPERPQIVLFSNGLERSRFGRQKDVIVRSWREHVQYRRLWRG